MADPLDDLYEAIEKAGLRTTLRRLNPSRRANINTARTAARLVDGKQSGGTWYRGLSVERGKGVKRVGNLSGEAWVTNDKNTARAYAGKNTPKRRGVVLRVGSHGRHFDHDDDNHRRALPKKIQRALPAKGSNSANLGAAYADDRVKRALRRHGFKGAQWRHNGSTTRYVTDMRSLSRRGRRVTKALAEIAKARELMNG